MAKEAKLNKPTIFVILGATGDLSQNKLLPALYHLYKYDYLPDRFHILGSAHSDYDTSGYREFVMNWLMTKFPDEGTKMINQFVNKITYSKGDFNDPHSFGSIAEQTIAIDKDWGQCTNKLFYLAVAPSFLDVVMQNLANSGLTIPCNDDTGWTRVLIEKPFGRDIETAQMLDKKLSLLFKEEQIFRIDHYLAKNAVQNIIAFRFSNSIFEPIWNYEYIEKVDISMLETNDVSKRGAFYDETGALRDVGQNHLLQLLALIAMDSPENMEAASIRSARADVMHDLRKIKNIEEDVILGQYKGYTETPGVKKDSKTETFFKAKICLDNRRWKKVPFNLTAGKALDENKVEIKIYFKSINKCICPQYHEKHKHQNILTFNIQPDKTINIRFWVNKPGLDHDIEPKDLSFSYSEEAANGADAYEHVLYDAITGDQTLFASTHELLDSWKFITPIIKAREKLEIYEYEKGSQGPAIEDK